MRLYTRGKEKDKWREKRETDVNNVQQILGIRRGCHVLENTYRHTHVDIN